MAKSRKLLERLLAGSYDLRFGDFVVLLEAFGFVQDRVRGSHHIFRHPATGAMLSVQPRTDGKAKPYQIRQLLKLVEEYDLELREG